MEPVWPGRTKRQMSVKNDNFTGTLKPLARRKSAGQHIFEDLKEAIARGDIAAGSRMVANQHARCRGRRDSSI